MKKATTAIQTTRQKITRIQRSKSFWRNPPGCLEVMRSLFSSVISGSAWCFMTIAGKPLFYCREFRWHPDVQGDNFCKTKSNNSGAPRLQAAFHYTESCPEWEHYRFYLVQGWKELWIIMLNFNGISQPGDAKAGFARIYLPRRCADG
jgi:hypothetical protein